MNDNINITRNGNDYMTLVSCKYTRAVNTRGSRRTLTMRGYKAQRVGFFEHDDDVQAVREYVYGNLRTHNVQNITLRAVPNPKGEANNESFYVVTYNEGSM